jgi:hypothetical protein
MVSIPSSAPVPWPWMPATVGGAIWTSRETLACALSQSIAGRLDSSDEPLLSTDSVAASGDSLCAKRPRCCAGVGLGSLAKDWSARQRPQKDLRQRKVGDACLFSRSMPDLFHLKRRIRAVCSALEMWVRVPGYCRLIWVENRNVCRLGRRC